MFSLVVAVILIVAGVIFSQQAQSSGLPINLSPFLPVWTGFVLIGWLAFRYGAWSDNWHDFTSPQKIVLETKKTPFQVFMGSVNSCAMTVIGGGVLFIIGLSATGHSDVAVQILELILGKIVRIIQVILE